MTLLAKFLPGAHGQPRRATIVRKMMVEKIGDQPHPLGLEHLAREYERGHARELRAARARLLTGTRGTELSMWAGPEGTLGLVLAENVLDDFLSNWLLRSEK
jgi:hypothetical protein